MTATITPASWAEFIRTEYLDSFIREGGGAIKFCVPLEGQARTSAWNGVELAGQQLGYVVAKVDATSTKVNLIEQLFFCVARQIDWLAMAEGVIKRLCDKEGYDAPDSSQGP